MPYQPQNLPLMNGLNEDENPAALLPGQLSIATNCCRKGNMTGTRPGIVRDSEYDATIAGEKHVVGMHEFRQGRDEGRKFVAITNAKIYRTDTDEVTSSSPTITEGAANLWSFANHQSLMWAAGGASNNSIWTWDGNNSNAATARLAGLSLKPRYVFAKWGVLFLSGFRDGTAHYNNPLVARYSDYAATSTDETSWPTSNSIPGELLGENPGVGAFGGEEISTGIAQYQDNRGEFLLFLTNKRILAFTLNPNVTSNANRFLQTDAIANGCVSQHAFVDLGYDQGDAVYVSRHGIHSMALSQQFGNRENSFLSWPIRKTWETVNQSPAALESITAAYWPDEGLVLIAVPTGSNTSPDTILAMDIKGARSLNPDAVRWYKWRLSGDLTPHYLKTAREPSGNKDVVYLGGAKGEVGFFSRTVYSDLGAAYGVSFQTKDDDYGFPSIEKSIGNGFVMINGSGDYRPNHTYMLDDSSITGITQSLEVTLEGFELGSGGSDLGSGATAGTLGGGENLVRDRLRGVGSGYSVAHRFGHGGIGEPFFIGTVTQDVAVKGMSDEAA